MANRFWVLGTANWDGTTGISLNWSASSGGAGSATGPGVSDVAIFDANSGGGTVTVTGNITVQQITMGAFTGTLDFSANNNNATLSTAFSGTGTGTRTLNMGSGTWTLSANTGTIWDCTTVTNFTFNANTSVISTAATTTGTRIFITGGRTYSTINIIDNATAPSQLVFVGTCTIGTMTITPAGFVEFSAATTTTIGTLSCVGTSSTSPIFFGSSSNATATIAVTTATITWTVLYRLTFTGSPSATNSIDFKGNSGITITGPSAGAGGGMRLAGHGGLAA